MWLEPQSQLTHPTISTEDIQDEVVETWLQDNQTVSEWGAQFRLATATKANNVGFITLDSLEEEHNERTVAKAYKTPKKRKLEELFASSPVVPYTRLMNETFTFSRDEAKRYAQHFDEALADLSNDVVRITNTQSVLGQLLVGLSDKSTIRMDEITDLIGEKPPLLEKIFDAPHVCRTIGDLATIVLDQPSVFKKT